MQNYSGAGGLASEDDLNLSVAVHWLPDGLWQLSPLGIKGQTVEAETETFQTERVTVLGKEKGEGVVRGFSENPMGATDALEPKSPPTHTHTREIERGERLVGGAWVKGIAQLRCLQRLPTFELPRSWRPRASF